MELNAYFKGLLIMDILSLNISLVQRDVTAVIHNKRVLPMSNSVPIY